MRKLKALAVSDLHLGEGDALLDDNDSGIIDVTVGKIRELSSAGADEDRESGIDTFILLGDIVDLSEAKDDKAYEKTRTFLEKLMRDVSIEKVVFVPGNHDHHIWIEVMGDDPGRTGGDCRHQVRDLPNSVKNPPVFVEKCMPSANRPREVEVCYPYYLLEEETACFVFDHGHLFSTLFPKLSRFPVIRRLFRFSKNTKQVKTLKELEEATCAFMEWVWYPKETGFFDLRERFYDYFKRILLRIKFKSTWKNTFRQDSRSIYDEALREQIRWYLLEICKIHPAKMHEKDFHLVFGHTHIGGRVLKSDRKFRMGGPFISVWNTGGWLVPSKVFSPEAYLFYIENTGSDLKPDLYKMVKRYGCPAVGDYPVSLLKRRWEQAGR